MILTSDLKYRFEVSFSRIIRSASPELHKKWNGVITWKDDNSYPEIQPEIIRLLPPAAKAAYVTLLNKLSRGNI